MSDQGRTLGKYQLIARLATGGMAEIFLARHTGLGGFEKLLVVKRILPHLAREKSFVEMFLDEARIAARLSHPNIVQIYDVGQHGGQLYIAMEYLEGESLAAILRGLRHIKRRMPHELAAAVMMKVCEGLHYAHGLPGPDGEQLRVIHRDVTPQNIFVLYSGAVKLIDFGIAKAGGGFSTTNTGYLKGKYGYMSPEQIKNLPLDGRSDIFSAGVVLWETLTGRKLYRQHSELEILKAVTERDAPAPSTVDPSIPKELDAIVCKALARDREQRYQTAEELRLELAYFLKKSGVPADALNLGEFMQLLFEDQIEQKRDLIKKAQQSQSGQLSGSLFGDLLPFRSDTEPTIPADTPPPAKPLATSVAPEKALEVVKKEAARKRRLRLWLGGGLALLVVAALFWLAKSRSVSKVEEVSPPARDLSPATAPAVPAPRESPSPATVQPRTTNPVEKIALHQPTAIKKAAAKKPEKKPATPPSPAPEPPIPGGVGKLRLSTTPWSIVWLGERKLGPTPLVDIELPAGHHKLRAVNEAAGIEREIEVDIRPDSTTVRVIQF